MTIPNPQSRMEQSKLLEEIETENIHLNPGSSGTRRGTRSFSRRIRRTLLSKTLFKMTQHATTRKPKNDFWSAAGDVVYRHHVELRVKLYIPRKESFAIPLKYIDVTRNTYLYHWMYCLKNILKITGMWMKKENYQMHGQASQDSFY